MIEDAGLPGREDPEIAGSTGTGIGAVVRMMIQGNSQAPSG
jgi:hypothetical protein